MSSENMNAANLQLSAGGNHKKERQHNRDDRATMVRALLEFNKSGKDSATSAGKDAKSAKDSADSSEASRVRYNAPRFRNNNPRPPFDRAFCYRRGAKRKRPRGSGGSLNSLC